MKQHHYKIQNNWTGNLGQGTRNYNSYSRDHSIQAANKIQPILGSSDPAFMGDPGRYNPEEMLLAAVSTCHMLWYLHLCSSKQITVVSYSDEAQGTMQEHQNGSGAFSRIILFPKIEILEAQKITLAQELHQQAHQMCFIANSCNFPIEHQAEIMIVN
jgi:organic hydroperoxide reductase OsmC/OhrA